MQIRILINFAKKSSLEMNRLETLRKHLKEGKVYRRADLLPYTNAPDRHLAVLVSEGKLSKMAQGVYYVSRASVFGITPPEDKALVKAFLKDDKFLILSPTMYTMLGVGATQLYNERIVYNHKRHGTMVLGGRKFRFHHKQNFPARLTEEYLLVDLVSNINKLAEDQPALLENVKRKASVMNKTVLAKAVKQYGSIQAKKFFSSILAKSVSNG